VQNLHNTCENFAHHIKDISKVDIESGSSAKKPTTTTVDIFIKACKKTGFSLDRKKATETLSAGIDPTWFDDPFTFPEFVAEIIQENYADKPPEQKRKLFRTIITAEDRINTFPEWRQNKKAEAVAREEQRRKKTAVQEGHRKLDELRKAGPQKCGNCGGAIEAPENKRGTCPSCGFDFFLNEDKGEWEFNKPISLSAEYRKFTRGRRQKETEKTG
jgi:ribosomal protein S27AE